MVVVPADEADRQHLWVAAHVRVAGILFEDPLYLEREVSNRVTYIIRHGEILHDGYCVHCQQRSTFRREAEEDAVSYRFYVDKPSTALEQITAARGGITDFTNASDNWLLGIGLTCQRDRSHHYVFNLSYQGGQLQKIGQLPSMESISSADLQPYRAMLGQRDYGELHRAGGLAAHGVGIGAFVYLRRVFERVISRHHEELAKVSGEIEGFAGKRMADKIDALSTVLPPAVSEFRKAYGILSKGIHELSEDDCKKHYPVLRSVILMILEEDFHESEKMKAREKARQDLLAAFPPSASKDA